MHNHGTCVQPKHTNAFLELNGIPYLVAEYPDKNTFQQIDRSLIKSDIYVDLSECMRAIVDISVDDIGVRFSDKLPDIVGNNTKQKNLLKAIANYADQFNHQFMTLKNGLLIRVNYQLENMRTHETIRSTVEDFRIPRRSYFMDINPRNLDDHGVIINFSDSLVSTMGSFTHGSDPMTLRITDVQLYYEALGNGPNIPRPKTVISGFTRLPTTYMDSFDYYKYQMEHQNHHCWDPHHRPPMDWTGNYGKEPVDMISPNSWTMFNRYYHFDNSGRDVVLHLSEVNDPMAPIALVPCGKIHVNRSFMVNPGHRIVFKFSIWKNDLIVVNDTTEIARTLKAPFLGECIPDQEIHSCGCDCGCDHEVDPDKETILRMLEESRKMNNKQNRMINELMETVNGLTNMIKDITGAPPCCDGPAVMVGESTFNTLQEAIRSVESGATVGEIRLKKDIEESIIVTGNVTLDLNGHNISAPAQEDDAITFNHTIIVDGGNLVINGNGIVSNNNTQGYCIMNVAPGDTWIPMGYTIKSMGEGTVTLNGGKYIHNTDNENRKAYVIVNHGARMTINDGVSVDTDRDDSSLVVNGFMHDAPSAPIMIINGGNFRGGRHTINNDHGGRIIINGGTFTMGTPWPDVNFASGPKNVFRNEENSTSQIKGGTFIGNVENTNTTPGSLKISGGKFSTDVKEFVVKGLTTQRAHDGKFVVIPLDASNANVKVGDKYYLTIGEAILDAPENSTINLMSGGTFAELFGHEAGAADKPAYSVDNRYKIKTNGLTIDLGGNTITDLPNYTLQLEGNNITIKNGKIMAARAGSTAALTNGTTSGFVSYAISTEKGHGIVIENVEVTGGISISNSEVVLRNVKAHGTNYYAVCAQAGGSVTIEGELGTFDKVSASGYNSKALLWIEGPGTDNDSSSPGSYGPSSMTIKGGTFTTLPDGQFLNADSTTPAPVISGGRFSCNVSEYLAAGYTQKTDGTVVLQ